jgi:hypothetical protein
MKRYRVRLANDNETPSYYNGGQYRNSIMFAEGGESDIDLSALLPQVTNMIAKAILKDPDPENADVTGYMQDASLKLQEMGVMSDAILPLVSAAGKNAVDMLAYHMDKTEITDNIDDTEEIDNEGVIEDENTSATNYGYYDSSVASQYDNNDDQFVNNLLLNNNVAKDGMQVDNERINFQSFANMSGIDDDYEGYDAFINQMRYGGSQGKRKYMREAMNSFKKAEEGLEQNQSNTASLRGTSDDIQGNQLSSKNSFIPAVKGIAQQYVNKKMAEDQYTNMMQFGGSNRRIRRANRAMFGTDTVYPGASTNYEFGPFGGLRRAEVTFDPSMFGVTSVMPGMVSTDSGYFSPKYNIKGKGVRSGADNKVATDAKIANEKELCSEKTNEGCFPIEEEIIDPNANPTSTYLIDERIKSEASKKIGTAQSELNAGTSGNGTSGSNTVNTINPVRSNQVDVTDENIQKIINATETIKKIAPPKKEFVYIPGKNFKYYVGSDGKWKFVSKEGKQGYVTNKETLYTLKKGNYKTEKEYKAKNPYHLNKISDYDFDQKQFNYDNTGAIDKIYNSIMGNGNPKIEENQAMFPAATGLNPGKSNDPILNYVLPFTGLNSMLSPMFSQPTGWSRNGVPGQRLLQSPPNYPVKSFNNGGAVNPDLYKYIYGGDDFTQSDLDFTNSKDSTDPYFEYGGLYEAEDGYTVSGVGEPNPTNQMSPGYKRFNSNVTSESNQRAYNEMKARGIVTEPYTAGTAYDMSMQQNNPVAPGIKAGSPAPGWTWEEWNALPESARTKIGQTLQTQNVYDPYINAIRPGMNQPRYGRPAYAPGYSTKGILGQFGNMYSPLKTDFKYLSPYAGGKRDGKFAVDPGIIMNASLANIQKSGMIPNKFLWEKKKKEDGNWFERKLGFNKDKVLTISYMKPDGTMQTPQNNTQNTNVNQPDVSQRSNTDGLSYGAKRAINQGEAAAERNSKRLERRGLDEYGNPIGKSDLGTTTPNKNIGPLKEDGSFLYGGYLQEYQLAGPVASPVASPPTSIPSWISNPIGTAFQTNSLSTMGPQNQPTSKQPTQNTKSIDDLEYALTQFQGADPNWGPRGPETKGKLEDNWGPMGPQTDESPDTETLQFTEEKAKTFDPKALYDGASFLGNTFVNVANQLDSTKKENEQKKKQMFDTATAQQTTYTGKWDENSGTQNKMGFEGVVKKGGVTGFKKNNEYELTMSQIQNMLKAGYKIEFI